MNEPAAPRPRALPDRSSRITTPWHRVVLGLASLAVMLPWPLLGILLVRSQFDDPSEAAMLFGGVTLFPLIVLAFFGFADAVYAVLMMLVWVAAVVVPGVWFRRRLVSWRAVAGLLGGQSAFSFGQAAMGVMLIVGKSV